MDETRVRQTLGLGPGERLQERGVYPLARHDPNLVDAPSIPGDERPPQGEQPEVLLSDEWLAEQELAEHFRADDTLAAAVPGRDALIKRLDADPRILVFEHIDPPMNTAGAVREIGDGRWVMDTRADPAALVLHGEQYDLVVWGEGGAVRLYALRGNANT